MHNFSRVLKLAFRQRLTIAALLFTSVIVAVLWGLNIGTLYPMVEIVFEGKGVAQYVVDQTDKLQESCDQLDNQIGTLTHRKTLEASAEAQAEIDSQIQFAQLRREAKQRQIAALAWLQPYAEQYLPKRPFQVLVMLMVVLMIGTAVKLVALTANLMLTQEIAERTSMDVRNLFFRHALRQDVDQFGDTGSSGLTARLTNDVSNLASGINILFGRAVREPLKMLVCLAGAAYICPRLLMLVMVVAPLLGLMISMLSKMIRRASRRVMEEMTQLYGVLNEAFAGIRVVKAYNTQSYERARFSKSVTKYYLKSMKMTWYHSLTRPTTELLGMAMISLGILAGGYLVLSQKTHLLGMRMTYTELSPGQIMLFFAFLIGATDPARKLTEVWSVLQRGIAAANRIYEVIDAPVEIVDCENPQSLSGPIKTIAFKDIQFSYRDGPQVLYDLSLEIKPGETLAVVGPNGSGKSTLVSLLCRFHDPSSGSVRLNDQTLTDLRVRDVRRRIGLVTQRTFLFEDTILNNIRYGSPSATEEEVLEAAKRAHADEFIVSKTPDGYETMLGAGGMRLSGGQMQRIALARAILRDPEILVLDEATSQIDLESEALIHDALRDFLSDRTGIMITHRPTTIELADRVAIIEAGRLSDCGTPAELTSRNRFYASLMGGEAKRVA